MGRSLAVQYTQYKECAQNEEEKTEADGPSKTPSVLQTQFPEQTLPSPLQSTEME